jgi:hypothetical protein
MTNLTPIPLNITDVRVGDVLDLHGDFIADDSSTPALEFEYTMVEEVRRRPNDTDPIVLVTSHGIFAFPAHYSVAWVNSLRRGPRPVYRYEVVDQEASDADGVCPILGTFDSEAEAAEFIGTLPDHEDGRYGLDWITVREDA